MSVTREHMALFLTRLAKLVGIAVASDPTDPGFTDDDDLSAESQTAIAQLADLGITQGTSATTYSPAANVKRGHMALFIQRLMNKMTAVGGYLPSDVVKNTAEKTIGSPFTDLGSATKNEFDAITQLWELGVASGISDTAYAPSSDITRAAMAGFMASLMDHSNARPAGLTIQGTKTEFFGAAPADATVMVSYRSDSFAPMAAMAINIFSSIAAGGGLNEDGTCITTGDSPPVTAVEGSTLCQRADNDPVTDDSGNFVFTDTTGSGTPTANVPGVTRVYTVWTGDVGDKFDADDVDEVTLSVMSKKDTASIKVTSDINENADNRDYDSDATNPGPGNDENTALEDTDDTANEPRVDLDVTKSVTFTVQLKDAADGGGADVAKADAPISVTVQMAGKSSSTNTYTVKTDSDGKITYTVNAPSQGGASSDDRRRDTLTFSYADGTEDDEPAVVLWLEDAPARASGKITTPKYAVRSGVGDAAKARVSGSVTIYDQYGNIFRATGQKADFSIDSGTAVPRNAAGGRASLSADSTTDANGTVSFDVTIPTDDLPATEEPTIAQTTIRIVTLAADDTPVTTAAAVTELFADQDAFRIEGTLYSYDSDDTFIVAGKTVTLDEFEVALGRDLTTVSQASQVSIPIYDDDGSSVFTATKAT